jgi:hypothetical protein
MTWNWKAFVVLFLIGSGILIIGIFLSTYTDSVIGGLQEILNQGYLSQAQRDYFEGMLNWWTVAKITFYNPVAYLLTVIGIIILIFSIVYSTLTIWHESKTK